jgi:hypothetical protein
MSMSWYILLDCMTSDRMLVCSLKRLSLRVTNDLCLLDNGL